MTENLSEEAPTSSDIFSKIYHKTDNYISKTILVISLSGAAICCFAGYLEWGTVNWLSWGPFVAIPFTIIFVIALFLVIIRFVYSKRTSTKKRKAKELSEITDEEILVKIRRKIILSIILFVITSFFVTLSIVLTSMEGIPITLIWLVPGLFPGIFLVIEFNQIKKLKSELDNRNIRNL